MYYVGKPRPLVAKAINKQCNQKTAVTLQTVQWNEFCNVFKIGNILCFMY